MSSFHFSLRPSQFQFLLLSDFPSNDHRRRIEALCVLEMHWNFFHWFDFLPDFEWLETDITDLCDLWSSSVMIIKR